MSMDIPEIPSQRHNNRPEGPLVARIIVIVAVAAALGFMGGVWLSNAKDSPHNDDDFRVFWQSWDVLEDEFYYPLPDKGELIRGALQGLLAITGDRYTFLVPPARAEFDRQLTAGEFGGIGAYVSQNASGQLIITTPFNDFPAEEAGLRAGDIVTAVDDTAITGWTLDDAVGLLRGKIGTQVTLKIYRPAEDREFSVSITRARVELPTAYATMYDDVGYVRLFSFNSKAISLIESETQEMIDQGAKALILDLRGNPGGLLDQAVGVSDLFLDAGLVLTQRSRAGNNEQYFSTDGHLGEGIPLVVLLDESSASASEVVAGALRDRGRAVLIGQTSFGKGSVQHVYDLADGSQLHLTVALWFTPDETLIQGQGLQPDIVVDAAGQSDQDPDPYIAAALDYFAEQGVDE